ncbi:hypothetical protein C4Q31_18285 [Leptospira borgpetersenii serovar Ceylonica]|nr:hypothetical protein C4Q31_18285 [Leptospira borgpetersenii serovar Ceylonica]OOV41365.1 hypothetical protein B1H38_17785 [Leptospira borgpetersenii serovar Ballum]
MDGPSYFRRSAVTRRKQHFNPEKLKVKRLLRKRFRSRIILAMKFASDSPKLFYIEFTLNKT